MVAQKNKEKTDAVETERVERDRALEATERERLVGIAQVEKEKAIETQNRDIQEVIRERVVVERAVVEEKERIKDTQEVAAADRAKTVQVTAATTKAEEEMIRQVKAAQAAKESSTLLAQKLRIEAEAKRDAAEKQTEATKLLAEGETATAAASGLAQAQVQLAHAESLQKEGLAEAAVSREKYSAEALGITEKAEAMKQLDGVGREHEEFKLNLQKAQAVEIAAIEAQRRIAESQASVVGEGLKAARIDIVGGDGAFFDQITSAVKGGKAIDRMVYNSQVATDIKETFFDGNAEHFGNQVREMISHFGMDADNVKDLSIAALIAKMMGMDTTDSVRTQLASLLTMATTAGVTEQKAGRLLEVQPSGNGRV